MLDFVQSNKHIGTCEGVYCQNYIPSQASQIVNTLNEL